MNNYPHSSFKKNQNQSYYQNDSMANESFNQNNQSHAYYGKNNYYQQGYPNNQQRWNQYAGYDQYNGYEQNGYWNNQQQYNYNQNNWNNPQRNRNQNGNQYNQNQWNQNNGLPNQPTNQQKYQGDKWNKEEQWPKQNNVINQSLSVRSNQPDINDTFLLQAFPDFPEGGVQQVGRFGGKKKKKNKKNNLNQSVSSSVSSQGPKPKVPTIKEESSNEFYFPTSTEITEHCVCPFNPQHIMEPDRLLTHINNCKLKSQNSRFYAQCPYEPTHYVYSNEIEAHKLACPKRYQFVVASGWDEVPDLAINQVNLENHEDQLNFSNYNDVTNISTKKDPSNSSSEKEQFENHLIEP